MQEELLEALIKKAVDHCFEDDISKTIASDAIRKAENQTTSVKSLEFLALKAMVAGRRRVDDTADILFRLIFKESLKISDFGYSCTNSLFFCKTRSGYQKPINDPYFAYAVLQQHAADYSVHLILTRTQLKIRNSGKTIATIPNRKNQKFDTFWATRFFQLCLKISCDVQLILQDRVMHDIDYKKSILHSIIDSVNREIPMEGWKKAIAEGERTIYERFDAQSDTEVSTSFFLAQETKYERTPAYDRYYAFQI